MRTREFVEKLITICNVVLVKIIGGARRASRGLDHLWKAEKAKSSWAQIIQATASLCLLGLAIFGYFYTVRPIYQKQRADEAVAQLQGEAKRLQTQISEYAITQYIKRVMTDASALIRTFDIKLFLIRSGHAPEIKTEYSSWLEFKYGDMGIVVPGGTDVDLGIVILPDIVTGKNIIEQNMRSPEFMIFDEKRRDPLVDRIRKFVSEDQTFDKPLTFRRAVVSFPRLVSYDQLTSDEKKMIEAQIEKEHDRQTKAHEEFIKSMKTVQRRLLTDEGANGEVAASIR